jgi:hypothetical protein
MSCGCNRVLYILGWKRKLSWPMLNSISRSTIAAVDDDCSDARRVVYKPKNKFNFVGSRTTHLVSLDKDGDGPLRWWLRTTRCWWQIIEVLVVTWNAWYNLPLFIFLMDCGRQNFSLSPQLRFFLTCNFYLLTLRWKSMDDLYFLSYVKFL